MLALIPIYILHYIDPELKCENYNGIGTLVGNTVVCCNKKCKHCGGKGCSKRMKRGGARNCCTGRILTKSLSCGLNGRKAPCTIPGRLM